jgi:hypothetical protein
MNVAFEHFQHEHGDAGARDHFEDFVVATVKALYPGAQPIRAHPGDGGIDAYLGSLASGKVAVWQAKFYLDGVLTGSRRSDVKDSYAQAKKKALEKSYEIVEWTLCVPNDFDLDSQQWWDGWKKETVKADGIPIELWNRAEFRKLMAMPDTSDVRAQYFPHLSPVHSLLPPPVAAVPASMDLDGLLFVRQLQEAGFVELSSAKEQFYNAELILRDLQDKQLTKKLELLDGLRSDVRSTWEDRFNYHSAKGSERLLPELHGDVMGRIEQAHDQSPDKPFPLTKVHRKGIMHQVVDRAEAGWVRDFRDVAKGHSNGG